MFWPLCRNSDDTHPVLQPCAVFVTGKCLSRSYLSGFLPSFCQRPSYSPPVPSCIHPGVEEGCSQEGCWLLPTWGGQAKGLTGLMQPNQYTLPNLSYLCLKIHQRRKGRGWRLLKYCFCVNKSVPDRDLYLPPTHRTVLGQVKVRCGREVETQEPIVLLPHKDTLVSSITATRKSSI